MSIHQRVDGRAIPGSARRFISWWIGELDACLSHLKFDRPLWRTLLYKRNNGMDIYARSHGEIKHIATFRDDDNAQQTRNQLRALQSRGLSTRNVVLRLSNNVVLARKFTLPSAISDVIKPVLENKLGQIVPWPSNQSYFGYTLSDAQCPDGTIVAHCVAVRKQTLETARAQASSLGFNHVRIDISDDVEKPEGMTLVNLMNTSADRLSGNTFKVLGSLFMTLLIIGLVGLGRMENVQTSLESSVRKLAILNANSPQINAARSEVLALIDLRNRLINLRKEKRSVAIIMESLTRILPDGTQLTRFEMIDEIIVISGRTDNAAELIDKLEKSRDFTDVRFYSPTLRKANDTKEIFSIEVEIESALIGRKKT